jgi:acetyl esterase/lipase
MTAMPIDAELAAIVGEGGALPGDWRGFREMVATMYPVLTAGLDVSGVEREVFTTKSADGTPIALHWFTPRGGRFSPAAAVHAFGGGRVAGSVELLAPFTAQYVARSGVPVLSVEYRLSPEVRGTTATEDVFAGLTWLIEQAGERGVDPARVALLGESAGGGLAASAAIMARDAGVPVARQILIYPQLDDRSELAPHLPRVSRELWELAGSAWELVRGDRDGDVPATVVAARLEDHAGLAPAYLEVGSLDPLRDETVEYARRHWAAGVDAELHVLPGMIHGWDHYAPGHSRHAAVFGRRIDVLRGL